MNLKRDSWTVKNSKALIFNEKLPLNFGRSIRLLKSERNSDSSFFAEDKSGSRHKPHCCPHDSKCGQKCAVDIFKSKSPDGIQEKNAKINPYEG